MKHLKNNNRFSHISLLIAISIEYIIICIKEVKSIMKDYDYKNARQRVENILNSDVEVSDVTNIPNSESEWTFANGIKTWVSAIFVDLRESKKLFENNNDIVIAKVIRAFASEIVRIMNLSDLSREIGIRGDCVFGVFSTPNADADYETCRIAFHINTYMNMLNALLAKKNYPNIRAGIGVATSKDLTIKVGSRGTGIYDLVYIGSALSEADRMSKITNKQYSTNSTTEKPIAMSKSIFENAIKSNPELTKWISYSPFLDCCVGDVIIGGFNSWINGGMPQ